MNSNPGNLLNLAGNLCTQDARTYSPLVLAYIGDCVYEMFVRTYVLRNGNMPVNKCHKAARDLVRAEMQSKLYHVIEPHLTEDELDVLKRGRNAKSISTPKNADIRDYRRATGLEALMGFLYLQGNMERINELMMISFDYVEQPFKEEK
ncbi:MAG: Mini-ribonuclease 3 [Cellulosilyticaceae bacterium]